ncbi:peptidoglycan recognition protein family protein [Micromonospora thermarum]|uniref:N-acetylmuramoyl-L-alanine amidase n=1 Tax=Micromonospora thermarum TaxID=2720024 RepID=A0ABX0Z773_9ACTN|nr:N-acetylmuramoyl-L-alanine amidase [Micromonospora thermarum]NJP33677.1 N-acetylmuramoyl-L-alanine amidase [Micromonospora thermarum]
MARLLWLPAVLRAAGLTVHEVDGWEGRGAGTFGPVVGVQCHETRGSRTSTDAGEIRVLVHGRPGLSGPIAQLYLSRSGHWWVVASGTAHHNKVGWAGPNRGHGNDSLIGVEAQHALGEPWTDRQYDSYVRGVAAIIRHLDIPVGRVSGHKEHQPGEKSDPGFDMGQFRRDVALAGKDDDMPYSESQLKALPWQYNGRGMPGVPTGRSTLWVLGTIYKMVELIAKQVNIDPQELAQIKAAAEQGAAAAADDLIAAVLTRLPEDIGGMTHEQLVGVVATGVREAFEGGLAPDTAQG